MTVRSPGSARDARGGGVPLAGTRPRGPVIALLALAVAALLAGHRAVPGAPGTLLDTALPWIGLPVPLLIAVAMYRRAWTGLAVALVPLAVWLALFGLAFVPGTSSARHDLRVVSQNLYADNKDPRATVDRLIKSNADLIAVQEFRDGPFERKLDAAYPYAARRGTVALWGKVPLRGSQVVDLGLGWPRAIRVTAETSRGPVAVYVAHAGSARPGATRKRDVSVNKLAAAIKADPAKRIVLLGDLNTASTDRELGRLVPMLHEAQLTAGTGLGFTWPSSFPVTRPDHVLYRGVKAKAAKTLHTPGSDHRAVQADFSLDS
ncbi:endonuclease/exonuclease/phosphatase family protein [Actinomadura rupiterrae]|uniref:endonuclease/exonuclease/phosphatase family protein n=1 Tax=Actinomadura rupiterrae TaxID=559627 RepID=UPI0020A58DDD|nr:endonuclease/exonuclease/phosphatase family protein [Actinomadura rupiterrae]MCP2343876.1 vancomycin resistance protein VanJ [Actinomadura rupiterrae]